MSQLKYIPKLDALRAIAALMVVFFHYFEELNGPHFIYGGNGVQIFFVISGFLITSILLRQKENSLETRPSLLLKFITRRTLRLFPIYYLFLGVMVSLSVFGSLWICAKSDLWYYFAYCQNYLFFEKGFQSSLLNHTWSLAVEEQFYLFWPLLILLIPKKAELPFLFSITATGIISKIIIIHSYSGIGSTKGITIMHFDTLGSGALLAYAITYKKEMALRFLETYIIWIFWAGFIASALLTYINYNDSFFLPLTLNVMSVALVFICIFPGKTFLDPLLNLTFLQRIGKISYGIYLYHKPIPFFVNYIIAKLQITWLDNKIVLFTIYLFLALSIASLSWKLVEKRILILKKKFS